MRLLFLEDSPDDVTLAVAELRRAGLEFEHAVTDSRAGLAEALEQPWTAVIADYTLPGFDGAEALRMVRERDAALPFLIFSGTVGEERAAEAIRGGANDYVMKGNLARLAPALERELREAERRAEQRQLEEALARIEERYRLTFEKAPIGIINIDHLGRVISTNEQFSALTGKPGALMAGERFLDCIHPADARAAEAALGECMRGRQSGARRELRCLTADGRTVWTAVTLTCVSGDGGAPDAVIALVEDVTERRRADDALRASRQLLAEAERVAHIGSWEYDFVTLRRTWSDGFLAILGVSREDKLTVDDLFNLVHPDDAQRVREAQSTFFLTLQPLSIEYRILHPEGQKTLRARANIFFDSDGKPHKLVGSVQDVSELVAREEELRRRAVQQAAVANLGQLALSSASLPFLFAQAARFTCSLLEVEISEILQQTNGQLVLVEGVGWNADEMWSAKKGRADTQAAFTLTSGQPVVCPDVTTETRFSPAQVLLQHGIVCGATVVIQSGDAAPWGILGAHSRVKRAFTTTDTDFLRSMAIILGQAIERSRADEELRTRAAQQSAIAELGRAALTSFDDATRDRACELAARALGVEHACYFELVPDGTRLVYSAGHRWTNSNLPRELRVSRETQSGLAVLTGQPVTVHDYASETRFVTAAAAAASGLVSGVTVPVAGTNGTYGVLAAQTQRARLFSAADIHFMQSMANVLAEAIENERSRAALVASEERYRSVVEGASEIIFTIDADGTIVSLNRAFETVTGWKPDELLGKPFGVLFDAEDYERLLGIFDGMFHRPAPNHYETKIRGKNGTLLLDVDSFPRIENGKMVALYGFARDITETRRAERERSSLALKLEQANRLSSLGRLAATVAHEFNNVLMGVVPFVEVIRRKPERVEAALDQISRSITRGKRITEDILRFTQPAEPVRVELELAPWLEQLTGEAESLLANGHDLRLELGHPPPRVIADPHQMHQILMNLILNARDAMPDGGTLTIRAVRKQAERLAHISVKDTGCGMDAETLRQVFEPLFTTKKSGTGLGLAVAHQMVHRHGGEIFAESSPGKGTTFHILLPLAAEDAGVEPPLPPDARPASPPRTARKVLLVEDDEAVACGLEALLALEGLEVEVAPTGERAIELLQHEQPDVVILDVGLPDIDGATVYARIAEVHPELPVVFSTGHADRARLDQLGAGRTVSYLLKPYDAESLMETLESMLT
jgi:PAS domain S-box-containing protein